MEFRKFLDLNIPGCDHFRWKEVLWLNQWKVFVFPNDLQQENLIKVCGKLEKIRIILQTPLTITSGIRPGIYNTWINGANRSMHKFGGAIDFRPGGFNTESAMNAARNMIEPHLNELDIRMEKLSMSTWIHIDIRECGPTDNRYFVP